MTTKKPEVPAEPAAKAAPAPAVPDAAPAVPEDFDALLAHSSEAPVPAAAAIEETPAQKQIRELKEALAQPVPTPEFSIAGKPVEELTDEERELRDLQDQMAKRNALIAENAAPQYAEPAKGETILIHFLADGFTFSGYTWYRGQEVEFEIGGKAYEQQKDRNGKSWLDLIDDIDGQYDRWGQQMFARGPWRGKPWGDFDHITDPEERKEAEAAAKAEARRNRAAPIY